LATAALVGPAHGAPHPSTARPVTARVIIDNDFAGDPDGLFQLAHHLLSPSITVPLIVSSRLPLAFGGPASAANGRAKAQQLMDIMAANPARTATGNRAGMGLPPPIIAGAETPITARSSHAPSAATAAIVAQAMQADDGVPLFYAAGASLTELALAWLAEPRIGRRIKLIWIGGNEHAGGGPPPPGPAEAEFNFSTDPLAAQIIFNQSDIEIWQVPRDAYRQMLMSTAEIDEMAAQSPTGAYLRQQLADMEVALAAIPGFPPMPISSVYVMGDSPLVTLTALMTPIQPDPASSRYIRQPTPHLAVDGSYRPMANGRPMRVYTAIDAGLTLRDMMARLRAAR
ncbi:MAG: nucleoside hydrolase, partial [Sphingopyxis sp.]